MTTDTQTLDIDVLNKYLSKKIDGFGPITAAKKFSIGQSNPTFLLSTDTGKYVLRRQPPGELLKSAHAVDREYRVIDALSGTGVPVPRVHHLCEDRSIIGSQFYIMDFADGTQYANPNLEGVAKEQRKDYFFAVVDNLAVLHSLDIVELGLEDFGKGDNFFSRQIDLWTRQYRAAETDDRPDMESLIQKLPEQLPKDDGAKTLTHGDYKFDNVIFKKDSAELLAVLDWELSTIGHPLADLAYLCMNLRLPQTSLAKGLGDIDLAAEAIPTEEELVARYCKQRGIDSIPHLNFYIAFSFFRLASICQGVYKRAISGNASSEQGKTAGEVTNALAAMGVQALG